MIRKIYPVLLFLFIGPLANSQVWSPWTITSMGDTTLSVVETFTASGGGDSLVNTYYNYTLGQIIDQKSGNPSLSLGFIQGSTVRVPGNIDTLGVAYTDDLKLRLFFTKNIFLDSEWQSENPDIYFELHQFADNGTWERKVYDRKFKQLEGATALKSVGTSEEGIPYYRTFSDSIDVILGPDQTRDLRLLAFAVGHLDTIINEELQDISTTSYDQQVVFNLDEQTLHHVSLTWYDYSAFAESYDVYRNGDFLGNVISASSERLTFEDKFDFGSDMTIMPGTAYTYKIIAQNPLFPEFSDSSIFESTLDLTTLQVFFTSELLGNSFIVSWDNSLMLDGNYDQITLIRGEEIILESGEIPNEFTDTLPIFGQAQDYGLLLSKDGNSLIEFLHTSELLPANGLVIGTVLTQENKLPVDAITITATTVINGDTSRSISQTDNFGNFLIDDIFYGRESLISLSIEGDTVKSFSVLNEQEPISDQNIIFVAEGLIKKEDAPVLTSLTLTAVDSINVVELNYECDDTENTLYQIFRNEELLAITEYNDYIDLEGMPGTNYRYVVVPFKHLGNKEYLLGNRASEDTRFPKLTVPSLNLTVNSDRGYVSISVQHDAENLEGIYIYRDSVLWNSAYNYWTGDDMFAEPGKEYEYSAQAYRIVDDSLVTSGINRKKVSYPEIPLSQNLTASSEDGFLELAWDFTGDEANYNFDGFRIYREDALIGFVLKGNHSFYDYHGVPGGNHLYSIASYLQVEDHIFESDKVSQTFTVPSLSAPNYISAIKYDEATFNDQVLISWASDYQDTYDGYLLIRDGGENGDELFEIPAPFQESFIDMVNLTDLNYRMGFFENLIKKGNAGVEYKLLAFADHEGMRYFSDTVRTSYNFKLQDTSGVFAPVNFTASDNTSGNITLDWEYPEFSTSTFLLYRENEMIAELPVGTRRYQDIDVESGSRYIYHLRAVFEGDSSIFVADAGSISSGLLVHGKVIDKNYQPILDVKMDLTIYYDDLSQYKNTTLTNASGYFNFSELSLLDFTSVQIKATGTNSQFVSNPVILGPENWDGSHIYVEFNDATNYKLRQQQDVATPIACIGKADGGSGTLFLTWGASNPNFSYIEISRGFRKIGSVDKGQPMILIDSSASPGHTQVYSAQAFWEKEDGSIDESTTIVFIAEAPFLASVENLQVIPVDEKNRVEVSWSHPTNNVDGYYIYRNGEKLDSISTVPFIYLDTTGFPYHSYTYGVRAFWHNSDGTKYESEIAEKDAEFPEVFDPTNISLSQKNNSIEISWDCEALNFEGFLVYRDSVVIDTLAFDQFQYLDFGGFSGKYHGFGIAAFRKIDEMIITSRIREKAYVFPALIRIANVSSDSTDRSIFIGWEYGSEEDSLAKGVDGFKIFRDGSPEAIGIVDASSQTNYSFTDTEVDPETEYNYSIIAFRDHPLGNMESPAVAVNIHTEKLHAPVNFNVIPNNEGGYFRITWDYYDRLDIDGFYIYQESDGILDIAYLKGTERNYTETEITWGTYYIQAFKNGKYSDPVGYDPYDPLFNPSYSYDIDASKGNSSKVRLLLSGLIGGKTYNIKRDGELIATQEIPGTASEYVIYDSDVDPGRKYTYSLSEEVSKLPTASVGWAKPDGVISGFVRTPETAGVPSVIITYLGRIYDADSSFSYVVDTTETDESGAYAFGQVTYNSSTEYVVKAFRPGHHFKEDVKTVTITENRFQVSCDFTDTTAVILLGTVKHESLNQGWEDVPVMLTTSKIGGTQEYDSSFTDVNGFYSFVIEPDNPEITGYEVEVMPDVVTLEKDYSYIQEKISFSTDSLRKFAAVTEVDFMDTLTSSLNIQVVNGGGKVIPKRFKLKIYNKDYKFEKTVTTNSIGKIDLRVAAIDYTVDVTGVADNELDNELYGTYFKGKPEWTYLSPNKVIKADTTVFVYHTPARIEILYSNMVFQPCLDDYSIKQEEYYVLDFGVTEIHGGKEVPVNSGHILVRNGAAAEYLDTIDYVPSGRFESMYFRGGEPELVKPYRKYMHASFFDDHGQKLGELSIPIIVEGKKSLGGTDIFINPENYGDHATAHIPMYVLRDPPGDGSSSFLESGVTINRSLELNESKAYYSGFKTEGTVTVGGVGAYWEVDLKTSATTEKSSNYEMSLTTSQRLETSSDALEGQGGKPLVGKQADVVVGMDMLFTYTIQYNLEIKDCKISRTTIRTYKPTGIKSTWLFTRNQIEAKVNEFSNSADVLVKGKSTGVKDGGSIESLQALGENWQNVIDYIDRSGDPSAWIESYSRNLKARKSKLEFYHLEARIASLIFLQYNYSYYKSLAEQLKTILDGMDALIKFLDAGPGTDNPEYASGADLQWYTEAITKINAFEKIDVMDISKLGSSQKSRAEIEKIYQALVKEADVLYGDMISYPLPSNYTFGGGTSFESSSENSISSSTSLSQNFTSENSGGGGLAVDVEADAEVGWWAAYFSTKVLKVETKIGGYGGADISTSATNSEGEETVTSSGFTLSDDDPGDQFSVNVYPSLDPTQTAYFALVGGRSSCPEEEGTIFRDAPTLSVENPLGEEIVSNLMEGLSGTEAIFPLKIGSLNPFSEERSYVLTVNPTSNRFNATIMANGKPLGEQTYSVSSTEPIFVDLSITRRPGVYEADSIEVKLSSDCDGNISESVYVSAFWERPCTPVAIVEPLDRWVANRYKDELLVKISEFDPDSEVLGSMRLESRRGGSNNWELISEISADSVRAFVQATSLIYTKPTFIFTWYINDPEVVWDDGEYQLRVIADCNSEGGGQVYSNLVSGTIDRKNIRLAGPPEPLSGVLTLASVVKARFTEEVSNFGYRIMTEAGEVAAGLEMILDGQEIVLLGADNTWRNLHHGERFTVELSNVEDYWGNSTSNTSDSLITWDFRVWNSPVYLKRDKYDVSVPLNGKIGFGDLISNQIACDPSYYGQTATYTITSSAPASLSVNAPQSIQLPGYDSLNVTLYGNREVGVYQDSIIISMLTIDGNLYSDIVVWVRVNVVPELAPWYVDESRFESTMNIVANYSLNDELSRDPLDMIAVFINNEIRGLAQIEDAGNGNWTAFITAGEFSDEDLDGLPLEFRIWDASQGKEYDGHPMEVVYFNSNSAVGTSFEPLTLYVDPVTDLVSYHPLHGGWNYVAFTPSVLRGDVNEVLKSIRPTRESVIKTLEGFATYAPGHGWLSSGEEFDIDPLKGYMLYLSREDELRYTGGIHMQDTVLDINRGWNLIAYPFATAGNLLDVLELPATSTADLIKGEGPGGQLQFSDYSSSAWNGSLNSLSPMYSYLLKSDGSSNPKLIWTSPGSTKSGLPGGVKSQAASENDVNPGDFESNMTVIGIINLDGIESISSRDSIIVMNGDTVVGKTALKYRPEFTRYYASFMIYGNRNGDVLDAYLYSYDRDTRYKVWSQVKFGENTALGSWDIPHQFSATTSVGVDDLSTSAQGMRAWIDNSQKVCKIEFYTDRNADYQFGIYDVLGQKIIDVEYHSNTGKNYLEIPMNDSRFSSGIFFLRLSNSNSSAIKLFLH